MLTQISALFTGGEWCTAEIVRMHFFLLFHILAHDQMARIQSCEYKRKFGYYRQARYAQRPGQSSEGLLSVPFSACLPEDARIRTYPPLEGERGSGRLSLSHIPIGHAE